MMANEFAAPEMEGTVDKMKHFISNVVDKLEETVLGETSSLSSTSFANRVRQHKYQLSWAKIHALEESERQWRIEEDNSILMKREMVAGLSKEVMNSFQQKKERQSWFKEQEEQERQWKLTAFDHTLFIEAAKMRSQLVMQHFHEIEERKNMFITLYEQERERRMDQQNVEMDKLKASTIAWIVRNNFELLQKNEADARMQSLQRTQKMEDEARRWRIIDTDTNLARNKSKEVATLVKNYLWSPQRFMKVSSNMLSNLLSSVEEERKTRMQQLHMDYAMEKAYQVSNILSSYLQQPWSAGMTNLEHLKKRMEEERDYRMQQLDVSEVKKKVAATVSGLVQSYFQQPYNKPTKDVKLATRTRNVEEMERKRRMSLPQYAQDEQKQQANKLSKLVAESFEKPWTTHDQALQMTKDLEESERNSRMNDLNQEKAKQNAERLADIVYNAAPAGVGSF